MLRRTNLVHNMQAKGKAKRRHIGIVHTDNPFDVNYIVISSDVFGSIPNSTSQMLSTVGSLSASEGMM